MAQLLGIRMEDGLHREFKALCARQGLSMTHVVRDLVQAWVEGQKGEVSDGKEADRDREQ